MYLTRTRLADGREFLFFDDDLTDRGPHDPRDLPARPGQSAMRYDVLNGEWITFPTHRQNRTHLPAEDQCPLCISTADYASEIPNKSYDVAVFENRFPSFSGSLVEPLDSESLTGVAAGRCEVVAFTSEHQGSLAQLSPQRVATVLTAWVQRTEELSKLDEIQQVFIFENRGVDVGVTLHHPHGQIYAYPFVTPRTQQHLQQAQLYLATHQGKHPMAAALEKEHEDRERIIHRGEHWTAFVPFAARMPVEVHLVPHQQHADLTELSDAEKQEFVELYPALLRSIDALYQTPTGYISAWHQAPVREKRELGYLHLQLTSPRRAENKLKYLAGSEAAMGAFVADVTPEDTAARLREHFTLEAPVLKTKKATEKAQQHDNR